VFRSGRVGPALLVIQCLPPLPSTDLPFLLPYIDLKKWLT
jgi:hypothetical protein